MQALPAERGLKQLPLFRSGGLKPAATLDVHAISIPARAFTGDFYFVRHADDRFLFALGDVAGKGLNAAVVMAMIQEELERTSCDDPSADMMRLHTFLKPLIPMNRFATAVVGYVSDEGVVKLANAGHCPPILVRADGTFEEISSTGPVLGVLSSSRWSTYETTLRRGENLVLYSDGVIETRSKDGEEFGNGRLVAALNGNDSQTIAKSVLKAVRQFGQTEDDLTLLVIRR